MRLVTSSVLKVACVCALAALGLMSWSLFDPRPLPVIAAMSIGQALGTLSFVSFLVVVARDLRPLRSSESEQTDAADERVESREHRLDRE
jgi:hypothetical protein